MIVVTGAAGFIGSRMIKFLNDRGISNILAIDRKSQLDTATYLKNLSCLKSEVGNLKHLDYTISSVIHIGAISNTLEKDWSQFNRFNVLSTMYWRDFCDQRQIPLVWTSTSAIYGNGAGPLNQYATSKLLSEQQCVGVGAALRLFNVYGPNEQHKNRMASVIYNWFLQYNATGSIKIFENSSQYYRDLIHVDDVCQIIWHLVTNYKTGIYDVGTGVSENMEKIAIGLLQQLDADESAIIKIKMPLDLEHQYQTNTCANINNIKQLGYNVDSIQSLSTGMNSYISYLKTM